MAIRDAPPYPATTTIANSQPSATGMFLFMTVRTASSRIGIVPPSPMISSTPPCNARKNASVTTNDGIPRRATRIAMARPMATPAPSDEQDRRGHAQPCLVRVTARIDAPMPAVKPAERSISPSSRTKTSPMARTMIAAPWLMRLAKFAFDRNASGSMIPKITTSTTTPMTAGSAPRSPPLMRSKYSPAAEPRVTCSSPSKAYSDLASVGVLMPHLRRWRRPPRAAGPCRPSGRR